MQAHRRFALLPALAVLPIAGFLAACGVKGDLERPTAAGAPAAQQERVARQAGETNEGAASASATKKVFVERSVVRGSAAESVIPEMPPKEWSRPRVYQPERREGTVETKNPRSAPDPDKPFALDWLL